MNQHVPVPEEVLSGLRGYWYPVLPAADLSSDQPQPIRRLGEDLILWRDSTGEPHLFDDRCPHRSAPLSMGQIKGDRLECGYHGLQFDTEGQCRRVPIDRADDGPRCAALRVGSYPCQERAGYLWAYFPTDEQCEIPALELEEQVTNPEYEWFLVSAEYEANWLTSIENAFDPAHGPYLHSDAPFFPDNMDEIADWFLPADLSSRTVEVATPSGSGVRRGVVQDGHRQDGKEDVEEFIAPCLNKITAPLPDGGEPMWSVHYHVPIDAEHTVGYWYMSRRVKTDEDRQRWRSMWESFIGPATQQIYRQDVAVCEAQTRARRASSCHERLLPQDGGWLRAQRLIVDLLNSGGQAHAR